MIILTIIYTICTLISEVLCLSCINFWTSRGLGASMAKTFSDAGYRVALTF